MALWEIGAFGSRQMRVSCEFRSAGQGTVFINMAMKQIYHRRRARLFEDIGRDAIAIVPNPDVSFRNQDVEYPFRAHSDVLFLSGFAEPQVLLVLLNHRGRHRFVVFCRPKNAHEEMWMGRRAGCEGAIAQYGADEAYPIDKVDEILPGLMDGCERIYLTTGVHPQLDRKILKWMDGLRSRARAGVGAPDALLSLDPFLHEYRLLKDDTEIAFMREAAVISVTAHERLMRRCRVGMMEYEIEAEIIHECLSKGSRNQAYPSIVATGANACTLHYTDNAARLKDGDLLLVDAGAEYHGYAADITRTIPVNGRFSNDQRALYELVLKAQTAAIAQVRPGRRWDAPHRAAVREITRGLIRLGILAGDERDLIKNNACQPYFMHKTGHWLGLDVHDVGAYKVKGVWRKLVPGMVLTVEPGIYIPPGTEGVDERWWGMGIRIEDDVLVTGLGHEVLTGRLAKTVEEIETLMLDKS